jgi:hypothetical protein
MPRNISSNQTVVESRKYRRFRLEVPVIFFWKDAQDVRREAVGLTRDLSTGGAFVFATTHPPLEALIKLREFLPAGRQAPPLRMFGKGKLVRVKPAPESPPAGFALAGGQIIFRKWAKGRGSEH